MRGGRLEAAGGKEKEEKRKKKKRKKKYDEDAHLACDEGGSDACTKTPLTLRHQFRHEGDGAAEDEETEEHERL